MGPRLQSAMAYINGKYYKVEDYPLDPWQSIIDEPAETFLKKGVVYRYETDITRGLYPFNGEIGENFNIKDAKVGIWYRRRSHGRYQIVIVRPHTVAEAKEYQLGKEKSLAVAILDGEYSTNDFVDSKLTASDIGKDAYFPPVRTDDDFLNKLVKLGIRLKAAPLEPYGKRMAALAVDKRRSVEGNNIKNNAVRRHRSNLAMSPSKAMQDADAWQMELVVGLRNSPGAMHQLQGVPDDAVCAERRL